ncbi:uncharacterized protein LOC144209401 [Stigmatopora nigra]
MLHLAHLVCSIASHFQTQFLKVQKWKKRDKVPEENAVSTMDVFWSQEQLFNSFTPIDPDDLSNEDEISAKTNEVGKSWRKKQAKEEKQGSIKYKGAVQDLKEKKGDVRKKDRKEYDRKEEKRKYGGNERSQEGRESVRDENVREETRKSNKTSVKRNAKKREMTGSGDSSL